MTEAKKPVKLLSGGNPQIAKGDGDGPVQDWIAAAPGWKSTTAAGVDGLVMRLLPDVQKAVRWNSPFYAAGQGWFLSMHCFTRYLKLTFLNGAHLSPLPPGPSKDPNTRYLDIYEDAPPDEAQLADWIRQAAARVGWNGF
ncbi:DUF1801 domain-containing protein [Neotabrizicola sp. VNH66]|uniref:DUF1801 domain-containing protein n=1 Tax=Neotabrizicola sp. VNH66 TaxID=3400918 RepID=UPI003C08CF7A